MPPITLEDMLAILTNPNFKTYLVHGKTTTKAWKLALAAQNMLSGVRAYLVTGDAEWKAICGQFGVTKSRVGVVFGRDGAMFKTLTKSKAEDFLAVAQSINDA